MQFFKSTVATLLSLLVLVNGTANARFVSIDPVPPDANTGENSNRYHYANNNPYRFVDPDGRQSRELNFETMRSGYTPPPRSPDDWLGPAIGVGLSGVLAAPVVGFGGSALIANPMGATRLFGAAADIGMGDAMGGASLAAGGATLFRVVDNVELGSIQSTGGFLPSPNGFGVKQFVDNQSTAADLAQKFTPMFGQQNIVRAFAPQSVMDASDIRSISDLPGGMQTISVPNELLPQVRCQGLVDAC